ncbi:hypothetical protein [Streptomyces sporangiiformans]|uniref:Uncharacterized protein n=1 Tax=Streptomyces sporangiiformans TaxID=2315329 RepID=A0A505D071_9ACTN|nr:hypothetical protein [Streptomyces sporangiiformans]TPQ17753.1 hypothetical protein FGD71_034360 [Streptomyces sporangiiformans]
MEAEVSAGWIGLIGASVGAVGALVGGWLQQRYQSKEVREQRLRDQNDAALIACGTALLEIKRTLREMPSDTDALEQWSEQKRDVVYSARLSALSLTDDVARDRITKVLLPLEHEHWVSDRRDTIATRLHRVIDYGLELIGAVRRGDALPEPSKIVADAVSGGEGWLALVEHADQFLIEPDEGQDARW